MSNQNLSELCSVAFNKSQFHSLTRQRRVIILKLFALSALFYFSIPFFTTFFPKFFAIQISGAINVGLVYAILQYPVGGLIAYRYAVNMRKIDAMVEKL